MFHLAQGCLVGGLTIALLSGAERSSHVADRYLDAIPDYDAVVGSPTLDADRVRHLPGVAAVAPTSFIAFARIPKAGQDPMVLSGNLFDFARLRDPTIQVLEGRLPDGTDPFEIILNRSAAGAVGAHSGEHVTLRSFGNDQLPEISQGIFHPTGPTYTFLVAAIVRFPDEIATAEVSGTPTNTEVSHALLGIDQRFQNAHRTESLDFGTSYLVRFRDGADKTRAYNAFDAAARAAVADGDEFYVSPNPKVYPRAEAIRAPVAIETAALFALGIAVLLVAVALDVLLLRSHFRLKRDENDVLRGMGATTRMLRTARLVESAPVAVLTIAFSVVVSYAFSDRFPIGTGHLIDLDPGRRTNWPVAIAIGVILGAAILGTALGEERNHVPKQPTETSTTLLEKLTRHGHSLTIGLGAHLAFRDRLGRASSTARQCTAGVAALVMIMLALGGWSRGLRHVYTDQSAHGWPWDAAIGNIHFPLRQATATSLARDPRITALTRFGAGKALVDDTVIDMYAYDPSGTAPPGMLSGRLPVGESEIALGRTFALSHRLHIGSSVNVNLAGLDYDPTGEIRTSAMLRVVGYALLPALGEGDTGVAALVPVDVVAAQGGNADLRLALVRYSRHLPRSEIDRSIGRDYSEERFTDVTPPRVSNLWNVRALPLFGAILGALSAVVLLFAAASRAAAQHSHDLVVLHTLGLRPRHRRRLMVWMTAWPAVVAFTTAVPIGLLFGHRWWEHETLGLAMRPTVTVAWPAALVILAVLAVAIAAIGAHIARSVGRSDATQVE